MLNGIAENTFVNMVGWSLLYSLWLIPIIAGFLYLTTIAMRRSSANSRYLVSLFALVLAFAAPVLTVQLRSNPSDLLSLTSHPETASSTIGDEVQQIILTRKWNGQAEEVPATDATTSVSAQLGNRLSRIVPEILPWIVILWLAGVFVYTVRMCRGWNSAQGIRRGGTTDLSPQWKQRFGKLIHRFELSRNVKLAESVLVEVPTVIGWFRPVILVPPASFLGLSATHLEAILAHEIAHIKRHDYLVNLFQSLLELLMFYHPAVWWISGTVRLEREQACDDLAISITGDAVIYAYALIETERLRSVTSPPLVMAATGESLGRRVRRLVQKHQPDNRLNLVLLSVSLVLVCCGVLVAASAVRLRSGNPSLESLNQRSLPIHNPGGSEPSSLDPASKSSNNTRNVADINSRDVLDGENAEFRKVALDALAGREGTVVIMDPQTGQVFTVVNQDLALRKTWNPASTVKLITGMAAMDASLVNPDQFIRASAKSKSMDMTGAMAASDNAYFRALGSRVGAERFLEYARQFGFGERTGIQLENESAGYLPEANQVTDAGRLGSYGEGIEATPIQLATFVAALANGGKLLQPVMGRPSKAASEITPSIRRKLDLQPESLQRVIAGMTGSVAYGTGAGAQSPAQVVVGKTGTYELKGQSNGLFISYAPADKPRVVVVVGIRGQGAKGSEAAKIAGSIYHSLERLL